MARPNLALQSVWLDLKSQHVSEPYIVALGRVRPGLSEFLHFGIAVRTLLRLQPNLLARSPHSPSQTQISDLENTIMGSFKANLSLTAVHATSHLE